MFVSEEIRDRAQVSDTKWYRSCSTRPNFGESME